MFGIASMLLVVSILRGVCLGLKEVHRAVMGKIEGHIIINTRCLLACLVVLQS
jgi:hypothetical protein